MHNKPSSSLKVFHQETQTSSLSVPWLPNPQVIPYFLQANRLSANWPGRSQSSEAEGLGSNLSSFRLCCVLERFILHQCHFLCGAFPNYPPLLHQTGHKYSQILTTRCTARTPACQILKWSLLGSKNCLICFHRIRWMQSILSIGRIGRSPCFL